MKGLSYQRKTWLLYLLLVLLVYLLHKRMFTPTLDLISQVGDFSEKMGNGQAGTFVNAEELKWELDQYNGLSVINEDSLDPGNEVLNLIASGDEDLDVAIESLEQASIQEVNRYRIHTFPVKLSGNFIALLTAIDQLEMSLRLTRISSVRFYTEQKNSNSPKLYAELWLQYITKD